MALLFMDGCLAGDAATKWSSTQLPTRSTSSPPVSGGAYYTLSGNTLYRNHTATAEIIGHMRFNHTTTSNNTLHLTVWGDSGATNHVTIVVNTNVVKVYRGTTGGTLLATGSTTITAGWHIFEWRITINDTTGIVQVWLDGSGSTEINLSSQDTKNAGTNTSVDRTQIQESGQSWAFTDFVICDATGSANNARLSEVTVRTLTPNGDGNTSQLLGSDGNSTNNYLLVDEMPFDDADYVGSPTTTQGDTYTMTNLVGSPTVKAVTVNARMGKSDAGAINGKIRVRSGGTTYASGSKTPAATGFGTVFEIYEVDPATSAAWTVANVNAMEAGAEVL